MDSPEHEEKEHAEIQEDTPQMESVERLSRSPLIVRSLMILLAVVVLVGIFSQKEVTQNSSKDSIKEDFQKLGLAYHEFHRFRNHSPAAMDELKDFLDNPPAPPKQNSIVPPDSVSVVIIPESILEMVEDGRITVIWNAVLTDSGLENDKSLLAFHSDIASKGGIALTAAGRPIDLTPDAFKKYPIVTAK